MKQPLPLLFAALAVSACAVAAPDLRAQPAPPPPTPASVSDMAASKALYEQLCTACHEAATIEAQGRTKPEWDEVTRRMLDRGLVATDAQISTVVDYLAATHPPQG